LKNFTNVNKVILRADGSYNIGKGHLSRIKTLHEEFNRNGFLSKIVTIDNNISRIFLQNTENVVYIDEINADNVALWGEAELIIVDLYKFDEPFYQNLKNQSQNSKIFVFDDEIKHIPKFVDGVINTNIYADDNAYPTNLSKICGAKYYILRDEIKQDYIQNQTFSENIFICMGGTDPEKQTFRFAQLARKNSNRSIDIVFGEDDKTEIELCRKIENVNVHINPEYFVELLSKASFAISGAGTLAYELAYKKIPTLLVQLAENQRKIAEAFDKLKISENLGFYKNLTDDKISAIIKKYDSTQSTNNLKINLIDGQGVKRIVQDIQKILK